MPPSTSLVDRIDALLPQTQCTKCGFDGCKPYARAIASGEAAINRCPPGGEPGIAQLAQLLDTPVLPLDRARGEPGPLTVAVIDEAHCIGCTLCIRACPVDAILGANKRMHTVLPDLCTGCDLCVAPCPVDCITMVPANRDWTPGDAQAARARHQARQIRLSREPRQQARLMAEPLQEEEPGQTPTPACATDTDDAQRKRGAIEAALAQARARRQNRKKP